jgi:hypothetical protein
MPPRKCCCDEECQGCCFPYDYLEPPNVFEAGNYAQILKWEIDAPNCPELDGKTGQFSPETTGPHDPMVFCGFCLCYINNSTRTFINNVVNYFENGDECGETPSSIEICFGIQCAKTRPVTNEEECCNQFRLVVIFFGAKIDGGELVDTSSECFENEGVGGNPNFANCADTTDQPEDIARELRPVFCQCEDNEVDPPIPFQLVFDLEELAFFCPEGVFPEESPCAGLSRCGVTTCSLEGATMTVERL